METKLKVKEYKYLTIFLESNGNKTDKYGEITNIHFTDENLKKILKNKTANKIHDLDLFLKALSLCHSVIVEKNEKVNLEYHASSIDEKALVNGARYLDYIFKGKDNKGNLLLEINKNINKFATLNIIEFDSKRKRMSVIVKDLQNDKIILFCKGADSVLRNLTSQNKEYLPINEQHLIDFSTLGLRNFNVAYRYLEEKEYEEWSNLYSVKYSLILGSN